MTFFVQRNSGANRPLLISGKSWSSLAHWASGAKQRACLGDHGFVQSEKESFAETMARALGMNMDELRVCIAQNRISSALLESFRELENTTDIDVCLKDFCASNGAHQRVGRYKAKCQK
jgi:hypothetical protein